MSKCGTIMKTFSEIYPPLLITFLINNSTDIMIEDKDIAMASKIKTAPILS